MVQTQAVSVAFKDKNGKELSLSNGKRVVFRRGCDEEGVAPGSRGTVTSINVGDDITVYVSPDARPSIRLGFLDHELADEVEDIHDPRTAWDFEPLPIG